MQSTERQVHLQFMGVPFLARYEPSRSFSCLSLALLVDNANNLVIVAPNRRDLSTEYRAGALNIIGSFGHNYSIDHHPVGLLNIT